MTKKIGFIGTGLMGFPMVKNILKKNLDVKVFNKTIKKAEPLKKYGAKISYSLSDVVEGREIIITMLSDDKAVKKVLNNKNLINKLSINSTIIDMSSIKPKIAIEIEKSLRKKKVNFLDAPVSGGTLGARDANLAIMVGSKKKNFKKVKKILSLMGNPTLVGPVGSGQVVKLANQIIVGVTIAAVAEAILLCEKNDVNTENFIKALSGGFADSKILRNHGRRMIKKNFEPKGKVSTHLKDMNNILDCANKHDIKLPTSKLIKKMFKSLVKQGFDNDDHSALYKEIVRINKYK